MCNDRNHDRKERIALAAVVVVVIVFVSIARCGKGCCYTLGGDEEAIKEMGNGVKLGAACLSNVFSAAPSCCTTTMKTFSRYKIHHTSHGVLISMLRRRRRRLFSPSHHHSTGSFPLGDWIVAYKTTMTPLKRGNNDVAAQHTEKRNKIYTKIGLIRSNYGLLRLPQMNVLYCALCELLYR